MNGQLTETEATRATRRLMRYPRRVLAAALVRACLCDEGPRSEDGLFGLLLRCDRAASGPAELRSIHARLRGIRGAR